MNVDAVAVTHTAKRQVSVRKHNFSFSLERNDPFQVCGIEKKCLRLGEVKKEQKKRDGGKA